MTEFTKDPDEVLDYGFDWAKNNVLADDESITNSTWSISPSGDPDDLKEGTKGTVVDSQDSVTKIWLEKGKVNTTYTLENEIETDKGRTFDQSLQIRITDK